MDKPLINFFDKSKDVDPFFDFFNHDYHKRFENYEPEGFNDSCCDGGDNCILYHVVSMVVYTLKSTEEYELGVELYPHDIISEYFDGKNMNFLASDKKGFVKISEKMKEKIRRSGIIYFTAYIFKSTEEYELGEIIYPHDIFSEYFDGKNMKLLASDKKGSVKISEKMKEKIRRSSIIYFTVYMLNRDDCANSTYRGIYQKYQLLRHKFFNKQKLTKFPVYKEFIDRLYNIVIDYCIEHFENYDSIDYKDNTIFRKYLPTFKRVC
jgi:hypothetical protein